MKLTKCFPYIPAMVNHIEKWLNHQANNGLILVRHYGWFFVFEERSPRKQDYYVIHSLNGLKQTTEEKDFHRVCEIYGKRKSKSQLNKSHCWICELDGNKIDDKLEHYRIIRNRCYKRWYAQLSLFSGILSLICGFVGLVNRPLLLPCGFFVVILLYAVTSLLVLKFTSPNK